MCRICPFICGNLITNSVVQWPTAITLYRKYGLVQPNFQQMEVVSRYAGQLRMCLLLIHQLVCWSKIKRPIAVTCVNVTFIQALELDEYFRVFQMMFEGNEVKLSSYRPGQAVAAPGGWGPHMKVVRLSALVTDSLYPQEVPLVLISVRCWTDPRIVVRPEGFSHWKSQWPHRESNLPACSAEEFENYAEYLEYYKFIIFMGL